METSDHYKRNGAELKSQTSRKHYKRYIMDINKIMIYQERKANPTTIWLLFLFLGWSYGSLGKVGLQILFYVTLGGIGIWTLIRLFTLSGAIKEYNRGIAAQIGLSDEERTSLGVL